MQLLFPHITAICGLAGNGLLKFNKCGTYSMLVISVMISFFFALPTEAEDRLCNEALPGIKNRALDRRPSEMYRSLRNGKMTMEEYAEWMASYYTDPRILESITGAIKSRKDNVEIPLEVLGDTFASKYGRQRIEANRVVDTRYSVRPFYGNCCDVYEIFKVQKVKYRWVLRGTVYRYDFVKGLVDVETMKYLGLNNLEAIFELIRGKLILKSHAAIELAGTEGLISHTRARLSGKGLIILEAGIEAYESWEHYEKLKESNAELVEAPGLKIPFLDVAAAYGIHFKGISYLPSELCLEPVGEPWTETVTERIGRYTCWVSVQDIRRGEQKDCRSGETSAGDKSKKPGEATPPEKAKKIKAPGKTEMHEIRMPREITWGYYWNEQFPDRCQQNAYDSYIRKKCRKISGEASASYRKLFQMVNSLNKKVRDRHYYKGQYRKTEGKYKEYLNLKKQEEAGYKVYQRALAKCLKAQKAYDKAFNEYTGSAPANLRGKNIEQWREAKSRILDLKQAKKDRACIDDMQVPESAYRKIQAEVAKLSSVLDKRSNLTSLMQKMEDTWKASFPEFRKALKKYNQLTGPAAEQCKKEAKIYAYRKRCHDLTAGTAPKTSSQESGEAFVTSGGGATVTTGTRKTVRLAGSKTEGDKSSWGSPCDSIYERLSPLQNDLQEHLNELIDLENRRSDCKARQSDNRFVGCSYFDKEIDRLRKQIEQIRKEVKHLAKKWDECINKNKNKKKVGIPRGMNMPGDRRCAAAEKEVAKARERLTIITMGAALTPRITDRTLANIRYAELLLKIAIKRLEDCRKKVQNKISADGSGPVEIEVVRISPGKGNNPFSPDNPLNTGGETVQKPGPGRTPGTPGEGGGVKKEPDIYITPSGLSLGTVEVDSKTTGTVRVENRGNEDLIVFVTGPASPFSLDSDGCSGRHLPAGGSCSVTVGFRPPIAAVFTSNLDISSNDPDSSTVSVGVTGTGTEKKKANDFIGMKGSYSGDGGCGIGSTVLDAGGQKVTLAPLGGNRPQDFNVDATGRRATSAGNNLVIFGQPGHRCEISIIGGNLFGLSCFHGSNSCFEQFSR